MTDLGTLGGDGGFAQAINDYGQVVGQSETARNVAEAFLYSGGVMVSLNSLLPPNSGWFIQDANDINDCGQIVGDGINPNGEQDAYLLTPVPEPTGLAVAVVAGAGLLVRRRRRAGR
jgi:MYXO-CTERM domain-containing protein